jgi:hypothetical protein
MMTPATPTIIRTGDQQRATGMSNRRLVPMPNRESRRRDVPVAAIAPSGLRAWHCFAFLIVAATIWYAAKGPLIGIGLLAGFFMGLYWLCRRYPKTMFMILFIVNVLLSGWRRR